MKKTTICSNLQWQLHSNFNFSTDNPQLKDGCEWNNFQSRSKISLTSETVVSEAGTILKQTISCSAANDKCRELKTNFRRMILRVDTNVDKMIIGTEHYPAMKTFSDNGTITSFTFTCESIL